MPTLSIVYMEVYSVYLYIYKYIFFILSISLSAIPPPPFYLEFGQKAWLRVFAKSNKSYGALNFRETTYLCSQVYLYVSLSSSEMSADPLPSLCIYLHTPPPLCILSDLKINFASNFGREIYI